MIRSIAMHNFVHFDKEQRLEFEEGTNFIIGSNSTGKTAIFELIRRCYSNKINSSTTSVPNTNKLAYAVCHFTIPAGYPRIELQKQPKEILTGIFIKKHIKTVCKKAKRSSAKKKEHRRIDIENGCNYYKLICSILTDDSIQTFVKKFEGQYGYNTEDLVVNSIHCKQINTEKLLIDEVKNCGTSDDIEKLFKLIEKNFELTASTEPFQEAMTTMNIFYDWLERGYVGILPMRSIGHLQWTNSIKLNKQKNRISNYSKANQNSEILLRLLGNDKVNKEKENKFHRYIVHPYEFSESDGTILVKEKGAVQSTQLLKIPEGVIEAKQLTLVLAHEEYSTITFEEPDRGMHPHMIKKMRDLILKHVSGKTVLVISHNPSIIDNWAMSRTFVCSKHVFGGKISHSICKVPSEPDINKYSRIDEIRSLLFSSRILFVEGITDKIIIDAIFCLLINGDSNVRIEKQITTEQKHFLLSIDIREMSGKDEGYKKKDFCEKLGKEIFLLFDSDQKKNGKKENVYIWKTGAIERRFIDVIHNGDQASISACNNIFRIDLRKKSPCYNKIDEYVENEIKKNKNKNCGGKNKTI